MEKANCLAIDDIKEGMEYSFNVVVTEEMIDFFADLSGDRSPIHIDNNFAKSQGYERRIAHGALVGGFISRLIGMYCPGELAVLHSLNVQYHHPTYPGDELVVMGVIDQISEGAKTIMLRLSVRNKKTGTVNVKGKAQAGFLT